MPVSVVEQVPSTGTSISSTIGSAQGLTLATTPVAGDVLVVVAKALNAVSAPAHVVSVTGAGATWVNGYSPGGRIGFWIGTGATTSGAVTVTMSGSGDYQATVYNIRGLPSGAVTDGVTTGVALANSLTGVTQVVSPGQIIIAAAENGGAGPPAQTLAYPSSQTPSGWTATTPVAAPIGMAGDAYRIPTSVALHTTSATSSGNAYMEIAAIVLGVSGVTGTARLDAIAVHVLARGPAEARLDAASTHVLAPVYAPEPAPFTIAAQDLFPTVEMAPFTMAATSTGFTLAGGTDLWIPATMPTQNMLVWLPDPASPELPSEGAWGLIVAINH